MFKDRAAHLSDIRGWIPVLPPFFLPDRVIGKDNESALHKTNVSALILRKHPCQWIVSAGRKHRRKRPLAARRYVKISCNPELWAAAEQNVFDAISVLLRHPHRCRIEWRPGRERSQRCQN